MKLAKDFECCPKGEIYPRVVAAGEECPPELEESARALGLLAEEGDGSQGAGNQQQGGQDPVATEGEGGQQAGEGEGSGAPRIVLPPRRAR